MKNTIGTEKTVESKFNLRNIFISLKHEETLLLEEVLQSLDLFKKYPDTCSVDSRGVAVKFGDKYSDDSIKMIMASGIVLTHPESNDDTVYLSVNQDVFDLAVEVDIYSPFNK